MNRRSTLIPVQTLVLLALFALVLLGAGPTFIHNGQLQDNLSGNGYALTNVAGIYGPQGTNGPPLYLGLDSSGNASSLGLNTAGKTAAGLNNTLYFSARGSATGTGVSTDPYAAGQFQAQANALATAGTTNVVFNLAAGTYHVTESSWGSFLAAINLQTGWSIQGAGVGVTTIVLDSVVTTGAHKHCVFGTAATVSNISIRGVSINCNHSGLAASLLAAGASYKDDAVQGVSLLSCHNAQIDHNECYNYYGDSALGYECFAMYVQGDSTGTGNVMTFNRNRNPDTTIVAGVAYSTGFDICSSVAPIIDHNTDDGSTHGFTADNDIDAQVTNNKTTANDQNGYYTDSGTFPGLILSGNDFTASVIPIEFNGTSSYSSTGGKIIDNLLILTGTTAGQPSYIAFVNGNVGTGFTVTGNHCFNLTGGAASAIEFIYNSDNSAPGRWLQLSVEDNYMPAGTVFAGGTAAVDVVNASNFVGGNWIGSTLYVPTWDGRYQPYNASAVPASVTGIRKSSGSASTDTPATTSDITALTGGASNGQGTLQTMSAATDYVLTRQGHETSLQVVLNAGSGAYTSTVSLSDTGCTAGDITNVNVTWPTSTNPTLSFYDTSKTGTLLAGPLTGTTAGGSSTLQFEFNGTAWVHFGKGEIPARTLGANVQNALTSPLNASTGLQGYTQPFDKPEHFDNLNHSLSASSTADTTFTADDGTTWTASAEYLGSYPQTLYDPPVITTPTVNGVTVPSLSGTNGTGIYYIYAPDLSNPVKNFGATFYWSPSGGTATNYIGGCVFVGDHNLNDAVHISFARAYCQIQLTTAGGGIGSLTTLYTMYFNHNTGADILRTDGTIYAISVVMHGNQLTVQMGGQTHTITNAEVGIVDSMATPRVQWEQYTNTGGAANSDKLYYTGFYANGPSPYLTSRDLEGWSEALDAFTQEHAVEGPLLVNMSRAILPGGNQAGFVIPNGGIFYANGSSVINGWNYTQVYGTAGFCAGPFNYNQFSFSGTATSSNNIATDFGSLVLTPTEYVITVTAASGVTTGPTISIGGTSYNLSGMTTAGQTYYVNLSGRVGAWVTGGSGINLSVTTAATGTSPTETLRVDTIGYVQ